MKVLAFTDTHGDQEFISRIKKDIQEKNPDILLCAGDITIFEQNLERILSQLNKLGKELLLIHGNHESGESLRHSCSKYENINFIHKKIYLIKNYAIIGYGGGGFSFAEPEFKKFIEKNKNKIAKKRIVLVIHQPPYHTKLDKIHSEYSGNKTFREFIVTYHPELVICGHLHENEGKQDTIKKTLIINPGPEGNRIEV